MFRAFLCKTFIHKPRIITRFCNETRAKFVNSEENKLKPAAFFKKQTDSKEISVHCIDTFLISKRFDRLWKVGDKVYKKAHYNKAKCRGDIKTSLLEKIKIPDDKQLKLSNLLVGTHLNIKPILEDFHEDDVRCCKLADISHLHFRN